MKIKCCVCGKSVSTEVLDNTIIRSWIECPECIEKKKKETEDYKLILLQLICDLTLADHMGDAWGDIHSILEQYFPEIQYDQDNNENLRKMLKEICPALNIYDGTT